MMKVTRRNLVPVFSLLAPGFALYALFVWYPTIRGFWLSLIRWSGLGAKVFAGVENFAYLFADPLYWSSIRVTILYMLIDVPLQIVTAYILAYLLYHKVRGYRMFRLVFFVPVILLTVSVGIVFDFILSDWFGFFSPLLKLVGITYHNPLARPSTALITAIAADWWKWLGIKIMLFFAGFQQMPPEVIEAATMDGARGRSMFFRIIVPLSWEVLAMVVVMMVIGALKVFDLLYVMTQGGPNHATEVLAIMLYNTAFGEQNFGAGSAVAVTLFAITLAFSLAVRRAFRRELS
jgi:raffinose/stachyose/melibiose transport system permease protein